MWRITILLIIMMHFLSAPAAASDAILGTIVSIDRENGQITVRLNESSDEISGQGDIIVPEIVTVSIAPDQLNENMKEGKLVRLWGNFESGTPNLFKATHIRSGNSRGGNDPTGVRTRLGRKEGMGGRQHGGKGNSGK
jgi:hypothetical protein